MAKRKKDTKPVLRETFSAEVQRDDSGLVFSHGPELLLNFIDSREADLPNDTAAARFLGIGRSYLSHIICYRKRPGIDLAVHLERVTEGAVTVESWTQPAKLPEHEQEGMRQEALARQSAA